MNVMDDELKKAFSLYSEICNHSANGNRKGMSIAELKRKYGFKKRDIVVLLQFFIDVADLDHNVDFVKYGKHGEVEDVELDNLEESAADGNIYIQIYDNKAFLLQKRIDENELNVKNDTFFQKVKLDAADKALKEISNISECDLESFIVSKGIKKKTKIERNKRLKLITAILARNKIKIEIRNDSQQARVKTINPLGLRYIKLQEIYELIYAEDGKEIKKINVSKIMRIEVMEEKYNRSFNISEYVKAERKTKMVLDIYNEGNVIHKWNELLTEYEVERSKKANFIEYSFMVENADIFENLVKSYGRSVIVIEPDYLRKKIYEDSKRILEYYQELEEENFLED